MSPFLASLPEKFSSALQPATLLDLLQIEGMKIEEESEVRQPLTCPLLGVVSAAAAGACREHCVSRSVRQGHFGKWQR